MTLSNKIKSTNTFKKMNNVQQKIYLKKEIKQQIDHALKMIELRGYEFWVGNTSPNIKIKEIVNELTQKI